MSKTLVDATYKTARQEHNHHSQTSAIIMHIITSELKQHHLL